MRRMNSIIRCGWLLALIMAVTAAQRAPALSKQDFIIGADISGVQAAEDRGIQYSDSGVQKDNSVVP
jgi:arabinogalactan endo-1,4-beta-galactosidase